LPENHKKKKERQEQHARGSQKNAAGCSLPPIKETLLGTPLPNVLSLEASDRDVYGKKGGLGDFHAAKVRGRLDKKSQVDWVLRGNASYGGNDQAVIKKSKKKRKL